MFGTICGTLNVSRADKGGLLYLFLLTERNPARLSPFMVRGGKPQWRAALVGFAASLAEAARMRSAGSFPGNHAQRPSLQPEL